MTQTLQCFPTTLATFLVTNSAMHSPTETQVLFSLPTVNHLLSNLFNKQSLIESRILSGNDRTILTNNFLENLFLISFKNLMNRCES